MGVPPGREFSLNNPYRITHVISNYKEGVLGRGLKDARMAR